MYKIYTVKKGDTLNSIANEFQTTPTELKRINSFLPLEPLSIDTQIIVPNNTTSLFEIYVIQPGDTMYAIAKKNNSNYEDLIRLNGMRDGEFIYPNEEILIPRAGTRFLITRDGDTVSKVVDQLKTNELQLRLQNDRIYLQPDQLLAVRDEKMEEAQKNLEKR